MIWLQVGTLCCGAMSIITAIFTITQPAKINLATSVWCLYLIVFGACALAYGSV